MGVDEIVAWIWHEQRAAFLRILYTGFITGLMTGMLVTLTGVTIAHLCR